MVPGGLNNSEDVYFVPFCFSWEQNPEGKRKMYWKRFVFYNELTDRDYSLVINKHFLNPTHEVHCLKEYSSKS